LACAGAGVPEAAGGGGLETTSATRVEATARGRGSCAAADSAAPSYIDRAGLRRSGGFAADSAAPSYVDRAGLRRSGGLDTVPRAVPGVSPVGSARRPSRRLCQTARSCAAGGIARRVGAGRRVSVGRWASPIQ
jgi:hypothetical protein